MSDDGKKNMDEYRRQFRTKVRFDPHDRSTRHELIRELAEQYGVFTLPDLAKEAVELGLYDEIQHEIVQRWAAGDCRDALRSRDSRGLPFAGPTPDHMWKLRLLWTPADYEHNLTTRDKALVDDYKMLVKLRDECIERFGTAVPIHRLVKP